MTYKTFLSLLIILTCCGGTHRAIAEVTLPSIGASNTTSIKEEQRIGAAWLKLYRRQVPTASDPILINYIEQLLNTLIPFSQLELKTLSLVVANNPSLNAFAVPGGIIGVHTGLFNYAKTEQQFASVIAHELAHLSQRHYARGVEKQKGQTLKTMAALLASLILAANSDSDAGVAALTATQALAIDQQLRFSRSFEQEADRIGIDTLARANMNPHAFEEMFEEMDRASRFSTRPPEFLLTHPLTANRIVDATNAARKYPKQTFAENIDYQLARSRAILLMEQTPQQAIKRFQNELSGFSSSEEASRYGLALALIDDKQYDKASENLASLTKKYPENNTVLIAHSDIIAGQGDINQAIIIIKERLALTPKHYPLQMQLSQLFIGKGDFSAANQLLSSLSQQRSDDPYVWFQLAEVAGLNNDISTLHKARAEYFILYGNFDSAQVQLKALEKKEAMENKKVNKQSDLLQYAKKRLLELKDLRKAAKI